MRSFGCASPMANGGRVHEILRLRLADDKWGWLVHEILRLCLRMTNGVAGARDPYQMRMDQLLL